MLVRIAIGDLEEGVGASMPGASPQSVQDRSMVPDDESIPSVAQIAVQPPVWQDSRTPAKFGFFER